MSVISLLTDFGSSDTYAGVMKGVIAGICPAATVIDLTHEVPPQDVTAGAFHLLTAFAYFPPGTVHVAVVDPGVGTDRKVIAVRAGSYTFVGPDNGVLRWAIDAAGGPQKAVAIESARFRLPAVSSTFHGRDVMAPAAAHHACGLPLESLGPPHASLAGEAFPEPVFTAREVKGQVIHVDRFGNCITNIRPADGFARAAVAGQEVPHVRTYGAAPAGSLVALFSSAGFLEIAVVGGSAAAHLGVSRGETVSLLP